MSNTPAPLSADSLHELKQQMIIELSNNYFESYRYDRPNDTVEQLSAFSRDIATNEVDELIAAALQAERQRIADSLPAKKFSIATENHVAYFSDRDEGFNEAIEAVRAVLTKEEA